MNFTVSTVDTSFDSLENLYSAPVRTVGYRLRVAALAIFLVVSSMNDEAYGAEHHVAISSHNTTELVEFGRRSFAYSQYTDVSVELNREALKLLARQVSASWQRQQSLDKLRESFYANFEDGQQDFDRFAPLFKTMAKELSALKIDYSFVDVSRKKGMIDFNLNIEEGIFLSVAKQIEEPSNDVMFTIARNHKTLVIDEMPLHELMGKVNNVVAQLKTVTLS